MQRNKGTAQQTLWHRTYPTRILLPFADLGMPHLFKEDEVHEVQQASGQIEIVLVARQ